VKTISLTQGKVALVDDEDYEYLSQWKWFAHFDGWNWYAGRNAPAETKSGYTFLHMHQDIMRDTVVDRWHVDHENGDGLNNQRHNLRIATPSQNQHNTRMRKDNTSGVKGVSFHRQSGRWHPHLSYQGQQIPLGYYDTFEEAVAVRKAAELEYHGDYARSDP
jgi:hypothetical protein